MSDIALDTVSHDIVYEDGLISQVTNVEGDAAELRQALKIAFLTGLGEYAFDVAAGMAYTEVFFVKPADEEKVRAEVIRVATEREGVTGVDEVIIETDETTRHSTITVTVATIYGTEEVVV